MSEYIDRDAITQMLNKWADGYSYIEVPTEYAIEKARNIPAADVVEVVRCEGCKHSGRIYSNGGYIDCAYTQRLHEPDFFCADGERKDGVDDETV